MLSNITGRLLNAKRVWIGKHECLVGDVYEDVRGRFPDGSRIHTSAIVSSEDGAIFYTLNSIYEVEGRSND